MEKVNLSESDKKVIAEAVALLDLLKEYLIVASSSSKGAASPLS